VSAPVDLTRLRQEGVVKEASRHYVVDDLESLGEVVGPRYEIIDGELFVTPSPHFRHQEIAFRLGRMLADAVEPAGGRVFMAPVDVVLTEDVVVVPDVFVVGAAKVEAIESLGRGSIHELPDLVAEVLSPGTAWYDRTVKKDLYERAGVPEYWIVDGEDRSVRRYVLGESGYGEGEHLEGRAVLRSPVAGGLAVSVADLFTAP
jgi:Uma2 family endonuclease